MTRPHRVAHRTTRPPAHTDDRHQPTRTPPTRVMPSPVRDSAEPIGPLLVVLRKRRGWSQLHLAERLCVAAQVPTVTRHEVSRWERQLRVPGPFWLGWLATVLGVPLERLTGARSAAGTTTTGGPDGKGRSRHVVRRARRPLS